MFLLQRKFINFQSHIGVDNQQFAQWFSRKVQEGFDYGSLL